MQDWLQHAWAHGASITTALGGAVIGVLLDFRRHTWATAMLAIVSGVFVAYLATDLIVSILSLPQNASNAIAALLGISGRNLLLWVLQVSRDPINLWDRIRGKK